MSIDADSVVSEYKGLGVHQPAVERHEDTYSRENSNGSQNVDEIKSLRAANAALIKDKGILEEIIVEKDKLINNLQLQIENLQNFSNSLEKSSDKPLATPGTSTLPSRSKLRSVSQPIANSSTSSLATEKVASIHESITQENDVDETPVNVSVDNDLTIVENTKEPEATQSTSEERSQETDNTVLDSSKEQETAQPEVSQEAEIPQRNPNHRIPPIAVENESPAKSIASSHYSVQKPIISPSSAQVQRTPPASPTRNSSQQHYMGIPVSDMVWGSSPKRNLSPNRGLAQQQLSPLRNQFSIAQSPLRSPPAAQRDDAEDEFIFSPIGTNRNGSSSNVILDNPRYSTTSTNSIAASVNSTDFLNGTGNYAKDLDSVVKYMDKKLNTKEQPNKNVRSRASTISSVPHNDRVQELTNESRHLPLSNENRSVPSLDSFKQPVSEPNVLTNKAQPFKRPEEPGSIDDEFEFSSRVSPMKTQTVASTPRNISTPTTASSTKFENYDPEELKDLMVRPNDLETTLVSVISVIDGSPNNAKKKSDDPAMTFGCFLVEPSGERREIFKFCKTYSQLVDFDTIVRPHFFELLPLPEMSSFSRTTPSTVEFRRQILNNYFYKLYDLKVKPKQLALAICRFVSTDPVFKFDFNEHLLKEGFMLRKATGKLAAQWKIVSCAVISNSLEVGDSTTGKKQVFSLDECKLINEEDTKDIKHAISIMEPKKNVLSSSHNRVLLCAESYEDKMEWLDALVKASSNVFAPSLKSSADSVSSFPSGVDMSPDTQSLKYNYSYSSSKLNSPTPTDPPATPASQSMQYDDSMTINSVTKPRKLGGLFSKMKDKSSTKGQSPEKRYDEMLTPSTVVNLESYQEQQQQLKYSTPTESTYNYAPYSPGADFSSEPELFGSTLQEALSLSSKEYKGKMIPSICYRCVSYLEAKDAIYSEGIFRLAGKSSEINLLNSLFNSKYDVDFGELDVEPDVNSISTLLKRFLRSLKESVLTSDLVTALKQVPNDESKPSYFKEIVSTQLPKANKDLLYILLEYLIKVIDNRDYNKMDINNITMLFSVNFNVEEDILSELIINFDFIFKNAAQPVPVHERPYLRR